MALRGLLSRPKGPFIPLLLLFKNFDWSMSSISFTNVLFCASIYTTIRCQVMMLKRGVWCFPLRKCWGRGALRDSKEGKNTPLDWRPSPLYISSSPSTYTSTARGMTSTSIHLIGDPHSFTFYHPHPDFPPLLHLVSSTSSFAPISYGTILFLVIIIHYPSVWYWQYWIYSVIYYTLKDGLIIVIDMFILTMISIYFSTLLKSWRLQCGHVYYV